ncbi:MAG TPA: hypothetical protein VHS54_05580, partial [Jatrophihabitans sp.]|nr:hypothetical protein [Jatrophihabitans sp.]
SQVTAADVTLPTGSTLVTDGEILLLTISEAPTEAQLEAETAEAAEELGIVEDAPDSETAEGGVGSEAAGSSAE